MASSKLLISQIIRRHVTCLIKQYYSFWAYVIFIIFFVSCSGLPTVETTSLKVTSSYKNIEEEKEEEEEIEEEKEK